jgi:hypothetical protein
MKSPKKKTRKPISTNSWIKSNLRRMFLRSSEHSAAMKRTNYCCEICGTKQSKAKGREVSVHVHHIDGVDWPSLCAEVRRTLLCDPSRMRPLCKKDHDALHEKEKAEQNAVGLGEGYRTGTVRNGNGTAHIIFARDTYKIAIPSKGEHKQATAPAKESR